MFEKVKQFSLKQGLLLALGASLVMPAVAIDRYTGIVDGNIDSDLKEFIEHVAPGAPLPQEGEFVHIPPAIDALENEDIHPKLKEAIRRGHDLFVNTQQLRGENVFNSMNCVSCHLGDGRLPFSGPVWPAAVVLPDFRPKNDHVNSLEERIAGCFSYSMNGQPPAYGSDDMLAMSAYIQWLAKGVPMYESNTMYGRGFPRLEEPELKPDALRGKEVYAAKCAVCHAEDGAGVVVDGEVVFPALWGDDSYNWGAGIVRLFTLASFIKYNMPLGQPNTISVQDAWDLSQYINSQERPQDPRYTGDVVETREKYLDTFHKHSLYGLEVDGKLLGDNDNVGHKDFLRPKLLDHSRDFSTQTDKK